MTREQELEKTIKKLEDMEKPTAYSCRNPQATLLMLQVQAELKGIKQGYAKALKSQEFMDKINFAIRRTKEKTLADVGKIIYDMKHNLLADNMTKEELCDSIKEQIAKLSHSQQDASHVSEVEYSDFMTHKNGKAIPRGSYPTDTHIPKIKAQIAKLEEEHKINNGLSIDECGYEECIDRDIRTKLRAKLAKDKPDCFFGGVPAKEIK